MYTAYETARLGEFGIDGWAGLIWQKCKVIGETPKRYRIEALLVDLRLPGRNRYLPAGARALVPKHAVRFIDR